MPQFQRINPARDIAEARQFEQLGRLEEAVMLYERVLLIEPLNPQALSALPRLYARLQQYDKAVTLLRGQVERSPGNVVYRRMLAEMLFKANRLDEARAQCEQILGMDLPGDQSIRIVAAIYGQNGMINEAIDIYLQGREQTGPPDAYAMELAGLYTALSDIPHAVEEYVRWAALQPQRFLMADERIEALVSLEGPEPVETALQTAVDHAPARPEPHRLLGNFYLRRGQPQKALARYRAVEKLQGSNGAALLEFAGWCERERFYQEAQNAYQELGVRLLPRPILAQAALGVARTALALNRIDEAMTGFQNVVTRFAHTRESEEAMFQIAELHLTRYHDAQTALTAYRSLLAVAPKTPRREDALFRIADCHVARGSLLDAIAQYTMILDPQKSGLSGDTAQERARYRLAEMTLFQGNLDEAVKQFNEVAELFPGSPYANDALEWSLLIEEARQAGDEAVHAFLDGRLLERQYRSGDALDAYKRFLNRYPDGPISDLAILEIGALLDELDKPLEAIAAWRDLIERYPASRYAPEAQRRIAEAYELRLQNISQAIAEYETVLVEYPDYLYNDAIRRKIRDLLERHPPQP